MGNYNSLRDAAYASHETRQRAFGGGVSDDKEDKAIAVSAVHRHEKHDHKGEPLTKLKRGGHNEVEGRASGGRRLDRKGKHKGTTVNIIMGGGGQGDAQAAHQAGMQQGAQLGARMAAAKLAGAGGGPGGPPPGMAPPGAPPPGGMPPHPPVAGMGPAPGAPPPGAPPMLPGRKRGGKAPGESMKYGAGSGEGRLEKEAMAERG